MHLRRAVIFVVLALVAPLLVVIGSSPTRALADDQLTQLTNFYNANDESKGWVDLSQTDVSYLRASQATFGGSGLTQNSDSEADVHGDPVSGWNSTSQSFSWVVKNTTAGAFVVNVLIQNGSGSIQISDGANSITKTYSGVDNGYSWGNWDKTNYGQLTIPSGTSTITIAATTTPAQSMGLLSLELTPAAQQSTIAAAVAAGRSKATWMKNAPFGVMYQWGQWGAYPDGTEPAWPTVYANADFNALAARDKAMGASFVVWSITWTQYYIAAPITSVDAVLQGRTSSHDYLQDMLTAFHKQGLRVIFYYHAGHDNNPNLDWWNAFWGVSPNGHYAQKAAAINRWLNIISEIGNRYGTQLDGWLFDDGPTYYPAPMGLVNTATRAGNPDRMVSFNSNTNAPRLTDYEDFTFGESNDDTRYPVNANGTITAGGFVGEQAFGNNKEDCGDWGVRTGDTSPITPCRSSDNLISYAQKAAAMHISQAMNQRMWSDLTQSPDSVANFTAAGQTVAALYPTATIDDNNSAVSYTGAWGNSNPGGCYNNTCHNVRSTGASAQLTFTGSGVTWNSILGPDQGKADVYLDNQLVQTVNLYNPVRSVNVPVFTHGVSYGSHTIKIVTDNASWVTVDDFGVQTAQVIDDGDTAVTYTGSWQNSNPGSCYNYTCHNVHAAGASATVAFSGTGITWNSIVASDQGQASVSIDGGTPQTVSLVQPDRSVGEPVFTARGLSNTNHTLTITTTNTNWVSVDSFIVSHASTIDDSDASVTYTGSWQNSNPGGCYNNTCHNVQSTGASAQVTFTGTGITFNSITGPDQGAVSVYVDGVLDRTVNLYNSQRTVGAPVYSRYGLAPGSHTLKIVTNNSAWVSVDSFSVTG
jgi:hypothetical protein